MSCTFDNSRINSFITKKTLKFKWSKFVSLSDILVFGCFKNFVCCCIAQLFGIRPTNIQSHWSHSHSSHFAPLKNRNAPPPRTPNLKHRIDNERMKHLMGSYSNDGVSNFQRVLYESTHLNCSIKTSEPTSYKKEW